MQFLEHRDIKLEKIESSRNNLVPEPHSHTTKIFT